MPEYTDALVAHIRLRVYQPYELIVFDNGSDLVRPSIHTTHSVDTNIQMVPGFMAALECADDDSDYYWLLTTSCRFDPMDKRDPLDMLITPMIEHKAFSIQPSLIIDHGAWKNYLAPRAPFAVREVFGLECVCPLYDAEKFNELGRWNEAMTYGWGFGGELHWKARKAEYPILTHDGYVMYKDTGVGYDMNRMHITYDERALLATAESRHYFEPIYGLGWQQKHGTEYRTPEMSKWE